MINPFPLNPLKETEMLKLFVTLCSNKSLAPYSISNY